MKTGVIFFGIFLFICFETLKFHRLWFDVYDDIEIAMRLYESEGFVKEAIPFTPFGFTVQ